MYKIQISYNATPYDTVYSNGCTNCVIICKYTKYNIKLYNSLKYITSQIALQPVNTYDIIIYSQHANTELLNLVIGTAQYPLYVFRRFEPITYRF